MFPTNPDLADILGDMDVDLEIFVDSKFPNPGSKVSRNLAWARRANSQNQIKAPPKAPREVLAVDHVSMGCCLTCMVLLLRSSGVVKMECTERTTKGG